jgi:hypothetical protein
MRHIAFIVVALLFSGVVLAQQTPPAGSPVEKARQAVDLLLQEKYAEVVALFSPEVKKVLSEERLRTAVQPVLHGAGAVRKRSEPQIETAGEQQVVTLPIEFEHASLNFVISVNKGGELTGLFMRPGAGSGPPYQPPAYSKPDSFHNEEVTVGQGDWRLPGTLSIPNGKGRVPAVVLVHGSGPNDRDETIGPNKPFRDLAEGLASRGIAVLRYEKRTKQSPGRVMALMKDFTVQQETIEDALAAAELLRTRPEVDPARVFVLGHSLGGYLMPRMARQDAKLAGLISLAGTTRPLEDCVVEQLDYIASLRSEIPAEEKRRMDQMKETASRVKALKPGDDVSGQQSLFSAPTSYWLDLKGYDPAAEARTLKQPLLILQGERDYQSTMADFARWRGALKDRPNVTLRSYPALNHLFIAGEGKITPEEYEKPGHVAPEVIGDIASWILKIGT